MGSSLIWWVGRGKSTLLTLSDYNLGGKANKSYPPTLQLLLGIVERDVSNVFYSERKVSVFYSQSDKILGVINPK